MKIVPLTIRFLLCLIILPCQADDLPPGVRNTQSPEDHSLSPGESLQRITVPEDFQVTLFAGEPDVRRPIAFDIDDRGRLWVVENYSHPTHSPANATDRVLILEDTDHDGEFDRRTVFYDKGRYLTGIAVGHGGVWLANTPELVFIPDRNRDDQPDGPPVPVLDGFQISTNNVINNLHWGPDGWLYGAIGLASKSRVGIPGCDETARTEITRGIWRYHVESRTFETVALGMVNPWGADFNEYGDLISSNTVLAHLWHILPGMYCERRASERDNPWAWKRIQSITNHLHWGGGAWQESRNPSSRKGKQKEEGDDYHQHSVAGGGHAHCGAMIYLGNNWPAEYRGSFFTNNLHGNRINNDRLLENGSTWTGVHADDVMLANDPWFRGMQVKYGPDGSVFVSDWHDFGECHDSDGSHRTSGRIYRIAYRTPKPFSGDLQNETSEALADLQSHENAWFGRHARRILYERHLAGRNLSAAVESLTTQLNSSSVNEVQQLRAFWALAACGRPLTPEFLSHSNPHVRRWTVRLLADRLRDDMSSAQGRNRADKSLATVLTAAAKEEQHPKVRLAFAVALQRLDPVQRPDLAVALQRDEDVLDPFIPLMTWYGMEPGISALPAPQALTYASRCRIPLLQQFIARRLAQPDLNAVPEILQAISSAQSDRLASSLLTGLDAGLAGAGQQTRPDGWAPAAARISRIQDLGLQAASLRLSVLFGDEQAISTLQRTMRESADAAVRESALTTLVKLASIPPSDLIRLATDDETLRPAALRALIGYNHGVAADELVALAKNLDPVDRRMVVSILVTRQPFAEALLDAVESNLMETADVTPYALQQLQTYSAPEIKSRVSRLWKSSTALERAAELQRLTKRMTPAHLSTGNVKQGRLVFQKNCARCHTLFGEGGSLAPDLTGSGRRKTDYVLRNLTDPSAQIDEAFRLTTLLTDDGRLLSGFIIRQNDNAITIRTQDTEVSLPMKRVEELTASDKSMMPDGMLSTLTDEQVRDLLVYLAAEDQVGLPE